MGSEEQVPKVKQQEIQPQLTNKDLQRILNPSESTQQLLQNQYQSRIDSIEECLTSRSNFLSIFQQMLEQELMKSGLNKQDFQTQRSHQFQCEKIQSEEGKNEEESFGGQSRNVYRIQNNQQGQKSNCLNQESQKYISQKLFLELSSKKNYQLQNIQDYRIQRLNQRHSINCINIQNSAINQSNPQTNTLLSLNKQCKQVIIDDNKNKMIQQEEFSQLEGFPSLAAQRKEHRKIKYQQIKILKTGSQQDKFFSENICREELKFKISQIKSSFQHLQEQNKKLQYFVSYAFNFLKSFLIDEIFKKGLTNIVQIIEKNYENKYENKIKQLIQEFSKKNKAQHINPKKSNNNSKISKSNSQYQNISQQSLTETSEMKQFNQNFVSFRPFSQQKTQNFISRQKFNFNSASEYSMPKQKQKIKSSKDNRIEDLSFLNSKLNLNGGQNEDFSKITINSNILKRQTNLSRMLKEKSLNQQNFQKINQNFIIKTAVRHENRSAINIQTNNFLQLPFNIPFILPVLKLNENDKFSQIKSNQLKVSKKKFISYQDQQFSYNGYHIDSKFHGNGVLFLKNENLKFEGEFIQNKIHGKGTIQKTLQKALNSTEKSKNKQNNLNTKAIMPFKIYKFSGNFVQNKIQGYGRLIVRTQYRQANKKWNQKERPFYQQGSNASQNNKKLQYFGFWKQNRLIKDY